MQDPFSECINNGHTAVLFDIESREIDILALTSTSFPILTYESSVLIECKHSFFITYDDNCVLYLNLLRRHQCCSMHTFQLCQLLQLDVDSLSIRERLLCVTANYIVNIVFRVA